MIHDPECIPEIYIVKGYIGSVVESPTVITVVKRQLFGPPVSTIH